MHPATRLYANVIALALVFPTLTTAQAVELTQAPAREAEERRSQSINGTLGTDDAVLDGGEYYEIHTFEGAEGQTITIDLVSEEFDTYLVVFGPEGDRVGENDDGDNSNAQIWLTLPSTGTYTVWATSYSAGEVGSYQLSWQEDTTLAELQQALREAREGGDTPEESLRDRTAELKALFDVADFYQDRDQNLEALETYQAVLELSQELGDSNYELISYQVMSGIYNGIGIDKNREASELYRAEQWQQALESAQQGLMAAEQAVQLARQGKARAEAINSEIFIPDLTLAVPRSLVTLAGSYQNISNSQQEQARGLIAEQDYRQAESLEAESIAASEKAVEAAQESLILMRNSESLNDIYALDLLNAVAAVALSHDMVGSAHYRVRSLRLNNEGEFEHQVDALEQALVAYETALPFHRESEQLREHDEVIERIGISEVQQVKFTLLGIINVRQSLSRAYGELGQYLEGISVAERTIELSRQLPDRESELTALIDLSNLYDYLGEQYLEEEAYEEALAAQEKSLFYAQERLKVAQSLVDSPELSDFESNTYAERGIDIVKNALQSISTAYAGIRWVYVAQDDYESALEITLKILEIDEQIGNPVFIFSTLRALFVDYDRLGRYQEALEVMERSLELARQFDNQGEELSAITTIASLQQDLGQYPEAIANYEEAWLLTIENEIPEEQIGILLNLGVLYGTQGDHEKASENYEQALEMARAARQNLETASVGALESLAPECSLLSPIDPSLDIELPPELPGVDERDDIERLERNRQRCIRQTWDVEQKALSSQAAGYAEQGRYTEAIELHRRSLEIIRTHRPDRVQEVSALNGIGATYADRGDYSIAIEEYLQALDIALDINHQPSILLLRNNLGATFFGQGDYPTALEHLREALTLVQETRLRPQEVYILSNIGRTYYDQGEYEKALEFFQKGLVLSEQLGQKQDQASVLSGLSIVSLDQGQYDQALDYAQQSLELFQETGVKASEAGLLVLIGRIHFIRGNYAEALDVKQQALTINQEIGDQDGEAYALQQLGTLYSQLGQYDRALALNQQALEISQRIGDRSREASTFDIIGSLYAEQGKSQEALDAYAQALAIWQDIGSPVGEARSLRNVGSLREQLGDYADAKQALQQALDLQRRVGAQGHEGLTLNGLAKAQTGEGNLDEATTLLRQAIALHQETGDRPGRAQALSDLGAVLLQTGQLTEAETTLYETISLLESLRPSELKDTDKIALFDTQLEAYDTLQRVLVAQNDPAKALAALEVAERGRARAFVESLTVRLGDRSDLEIDTDSPDLDQMRQIAQQQNATLIEYSIVSADDAPELYIWVIAPDGDIAFRQQSLAEVELADLVIDARDAIRVRGGRAGAPPQPRSETLAQRRAETNAKLTQLHELLIAPIADLLPTDPEQRVIMIPQGDLFLVPFPALINTDGNYLIEQHTLLTAPSIHVLDLTRQQRRQRSDVTSPNDVLVVGNPDMPTVKIPSEDWEGELSSLFWAEQEAIEIADLFGAEALIGDAATEAYIKQQMAESRLLHLATHGLLEYGFPDESGVRDLPGAIALTPGYGEDGLLTAAEIYGMDLNADLVVLSACDTGRGRITGDGVVGLSRAFISAGAPSVVVSLWAVPDASTAELMVEFYNQLEQGQDKAQALRQAMLTTMQQYPDDPKHWAAFTLIGEAN
ncbi:MAG: tetratricopeptide repeat protein [Leptolyngbya sp. SIO1E4]|nr:tetratricopeptide repeat protein [Leptolyngbya sp. SIO1E4]